MSSSYFIKVFGQSFSEQDLKTQTGFLFQLKKDKMILLRNQSRHGFAVQICWHHQELPYQEIRLKPIKLGQ